MEENSHIILVPWDFTNVSEHALAHAIRMVNFIDNRIELLHIIDKNATQSEKKKKDVELKKIAKECKEENDCDIETKVLPGDIFTTIANYATEIDANMVIMGTHGIKGMQKITGSWAYKVLLGSKVPFVIVKDKPNKSKKFTDIVFPVDFNAENTDKLVWAMYMGKYFDSKINIFKAPVHNKEYIKQTNVNLNLAVRLFIQNNIEYEIHSGEKPLRFAKETISFAKKINADLILIMTAHHTITDYILGEHEQYIIDNSPNIPVMCVNPASSITTHEFDLRDE